MAWTYKFDEIDKEVTKDTSTPNRFTFNRYLYFEPDQYDDWSKKKSYEGRPFTAELVGNPNIPAIGSHLSGSLSGFYMTDVTSISNLIEEEHSDHCSYAVVTLEYENTPSLGSISGDDIVNPWGGGKSSAQKQPEVVSGQVTKSSPPWEHFTEDFTVTTQTSEMPLIEAYQDGVSGTVPIATTAGQPLYGYTDSIYMQRISWTVNVAVRDNLNFMIEEPIINNSDISFYDGKIIIPNGEGLLMPPSYKRLYWNSQDYVNEPYDQWSFEIIRNPYGWFTKVLNAGTKFIKDGELVDICSWYVYIPNSGTVPIRQFNDYSAMIEAKKAVDEYNKNITNENDKKVWSGDFVQTPVPLNENGGIDREAIADPKNTYSMLFRNYQKGSWNILIR